MATSGLPRKMTAVLVYGRPLLVFGGMICALAVMWLRDPWVYSLGVLLLLVSMTFDLIDGWFAARFRPQAALAPLADRLMDKLVYSIIFPLVAVGIMWRFIGRHPSRLELLHAIFVLLLCVTVLIRDNFAAFMRGFALRQGNESESIEFTRLRTVVAAPVGVLLYVYAFHIPADITTAVWFQRWLARLGSLPLNTLFFVEIIFLVINFGSIASYCRKYGGLCLDELCLGDQVLRRRILSTLPNALTVINALLGMIGVFFAYQGRFREMFFMIIGAATFDKLDGALARRLGLTEPLPEEKPHQKINLGNLLDDFADAISFCIAPAWIFYIALTDFGGGRFHPTMVGWIAVVYAAAGLARLLYFTIDAHPIPGFFKGMPTPAAALLVLSPIVVFGQARFSFPGQINAWGWVSAAAMLICAVVMNLYRVRYIHMGRAMSRNPWISRLIVVVLFSCAFTPFLGHISLILMVVYLLSPLFTGRIHPDVAASESRR